MELRTTLSILRRWWWLIAIPTLGALLATLPAMLDAPAPGGYRIALRYSAAQRPEAGPPRDGDLQDLWLASELTINALAAWTQTASFRAELADALGAAGDELAALGIVADNQRSVGQLILSHPRADSLARIADAAMRVLQTRNAAYFPQLGNAPARVTLLDEPLVTRTPPSLTNRLAPLLRVTLGLAAGLGLASLAHYLDPALRSREELETLGLEVLAALPGE